MFKICTIILTLGVIAQAEVVTLKCNYKTYGGDVCKIDHLEADLSNKAVVIDTGNKKPDIIKVKGVHLGKIPTSLIADHQNVVELKLKDCSIFSLNGVKNFDKLEKLNLAKNRISEIAFDHLNNPLLTDLELDNNDINTIHKDAFKNTPNLKKLDLSDNKLQTIESEVFVSSLDTIDLENNLLDNIENVFTGHENLMRLDLSENLIEKISSQTFFNCKKLFKLDLSKNKIREIDPHAFNTLESLQLLELEKNQLKSFHFTIFSDFMGNLFVNENQLTSLNVQLQVPELKRKFTLKASSNMLESVNIPNEIKYKKIDLKDNPLKVLPSDKVLQNVEFLYLDNIDLSSVDFSALSSGSNLVSISLNYSNIDANAFKILLEQPNVQLIDVSNNPKLGDFDFKQISNGAPQLKTLEMNNCNIQQVDTATIKKAFPALENFEIYGNKFSKEEIKAIKSAVSHKSASEF